MILSILPPLISPNCKYSQCPHTVWAACWLQKSHCTWQFYCCNAISVHIVAILNRLYLCGAAAPSNLEIFTIYYLWMVNTGVNTGGQCGRLTFFFHISLMKLRLHLSTLEEMSCFYKTVFAGNHDFYQHTRKLVFKI